MNDKKLKIQITIIATIVIVLMMACIAVVIIEKKDEAEMKVIGYESITFNQDVTVFDALVQVNPGIENYIHDIPADCGIIYAESKMIPAEIIKAGKEVLVPIYTY